MGEGRTDADSDPDARTALLAPEGDAAGPATVTSEPASGASQGRYVVLETLGRGAMGHVLRAYDPVLQREVALKLVSGRTLDPNARERMLREARAMAQLSHPNVVAVYDAEDSDAGVVLVMEYVRGPTLRRWASGRAWPEIVARYVEAGRGLAAAHAVGLLHRDFKPDNVLVADTGTAKVTDFGLAKLTSTASRSLAVGSLDGLASGAFESLRWNPSGESFELQRSSGAPEAAASGSSGSLDAVLTRVGTVMGTPRYMAPEQHQGEALGPAADQYAFCVSLWESLVGEPPYRGSSLRSLLDEKLGDPPPWPAGAPAIPGPLVSALRRGLAADPELRFPSMEALLDALAHDPHRRRNRWLAGLAALGAVAVLVGGGWSWATARARRCSGAREHLAGVWDDARRAEVEAAMLGLRAEYAGAVWERTRAELDGYADAWATMHTEACEATTVRGEQSTEVLDLRMGCLHRARVGLEAVARVLASADVDVTRNAADVVGSLDRLERCADVEALRAGVEPPRPEEVVAVEAVLERVAEAGAELEAGRYARALQAIDRAEEGLAALEHGPVRTEVALARGVVLERLGRYEESEATLRAALESAARWQQWDLVEEVAAELMFVVGYEQKRMAEGRQLWELALGLAGEDPEAEANVRNVYANLLTAQGRHEEAEVEYRRALALREAELGPGDADVAVSRSNLGLVLNARGRYAEAEAEFRRALASMEQALGPRHPTTATFCNNLANALAAQGRYAEAEDELRRALATMEDGLGTEHPEVALMTANLAQILVAQGELTEAEALHRRALAVRERVLEPGHPDVGQSLNNLSHVLHAQARFPEAEAVLRRALPLLERALGPGHADVAQLRSNLGLMLYGQGEHEEAEAELRRALVLWEQALGPDHANVGLGRNNLALVLYATRRYAEAEDEYRKALVVQEAALGAAHPNVALARGNLAQVLLERGKLEEAEAEMRKVLAMQQEALGAEHPDVARSHNNLGQLLYVRGAYAEAEAEMRRAVAGWERALGAEHPNVAKARHNLATVLLADGRPGEALPLAEQAWARRERDDALVDERAASGFLLARTLWKTSKAVAVRTRAKALAERAREGFEAAGKAEEAASVSAWLGRPDAWVPKKERGAAGAR